MPRISRRQVIGAGLATATIGKGQLPKGKGVSSHLYTFIAGKTGEWSVTKVSAVSGESLQTASRLTVVRGPAVALLADTVWSLRGVTSNLRYTTAAERQLLTAKQVGIGRPEATRAALIPIRKTAAWWELPQDERRRIFEDRSHHTQTGLKYLPRIARQLHHCHDLSDSEPFDFLTWFDYSPTDAQAFEDLVAELRATEEWKFVEREVDVRLAR